MIELGQPSVQTRSVLWSIKYQLIGHNVTILINDRTRSAIKTDQVSVVEYKIPTDRKLVMATDPVMQELVGKNLFDIVNFILYDFILPFCESLLEQREILQSLKEQKFDLLFLDAAENCGAALIDFLDIPTLLYSNYGFGTDPLMFHPAPPSFVPVPEDNPNPDDRMEFFHRVTNFLHTIIIRAYLYPKLYTMIEEARQKHNISANIQPVNSLHKCLVITITDFALEFPRPYMPNIIAISGLFPPPPRPLDRQWKEIMDTDSESGVIVMSSGTVFNYAKDDHRRDLFARVFARLPQKVIWKYSGPKPKSLGSNTVVKEWLPQNDLLAHPRVKLFITHAGMSATFEAIQNTVPVVAIPGFVDQFRNAAYMVKRAKMGIRLYLTELTEESLYTAITTVINDNTYKVNAEKMRTLVNDKPVGGKELFLYWVNYTIRHKGAKHLVSQAANELTYIQYQSIDVLVFLLTVVSSLLLLILALVICLVKYIRWKLFGKDKKKQA